MTKKSILITGGAGFLGSHLTEFFLNKGANVIAIDDLSSGSKDNVDGFLDSSNYTFINDNIITCSILDELVNEVDYILNFAAAVGMFHVIENPGYTLYNNTRILSKILEETTKAAHKPLVIHASSSEVYGSQESPMKETDILKLDSTTKSHASYPVSKLYNEVDALFYYKEKQVPVIILRLFNIVGQNQSSLYGMVLPRFIEQAITHEPITIFGDGHQTRSFCHVDHLCEQIDHLINQPKAVGEIINVGNSQAISILDLARLVIKETNSRSELTYYSFSEVYDDNYLATRHRQPNLTKVEQLTNMSCHWSMEDVVKRVIQKL